MTKTTTIRTWKLMSLSICRRKERTRSDSVGEDETPTTIMKGIRHLKRRPRLRGLSGGLSSSEQFLDCVSLPLLRDISCANREALPETQLASKTIRDAGHRNHPYPDEANCRHCCAKYMKSRIMRLADSPYILTTSLWRSPRNDRLYFPYLKLA